MSTDKDESNDDSYLPSYPSPSASSVVEFFLVYFSFKTLGKHWNRLRNIGGNRSFFDISSSPKLWATMGEPNWKFEKSQRAVESSSPSKTNEMAGKQKIFNHG